MRPNKTNINRSTQAKPCRAFNSRNGRMNDICFPCFLTKQPSLKLKTRPQTTFRFTRVGHHAYHYLQRLSIAYGSTFLLSNKSAAVTKNYCSQLKPSKALLVASTDSPKFVRTHPSVRLALSLDFNAVKMAFFLHFMVVNIFKFKTVKICFCGCKFWQINKNL